MVLRDWTSIEKETMRPGIARQVVHTDRMTVARIYLDRGAVVPEHAHENEQMTLLERGRLKFTIGGVTEIVAAGQTMQIPPNAEHTVEALEDSQALDIFVPRREDWLRGDDAYLRG